MAMEMKREMEGGTGYRGKDEDMEIKRRRSYAIEEWKEEEDQKTQTERKLLYRRIMVEERR